MKLHLKAAFADAVALKWIALPKAQMQAAKWG